jgi:hypothetical protein
MWNTLGSISRKRTLMRTSKIMKQMHCASQLKLFCANVRRDQKGELYKLNTFNQIVYALKKHLLKHDIDVDGEEFASYRETTKSMRKKISKAGKGKTVHKESISKDDLITLYSPGMFTKYTK